MGQALEGFVEQGGVVVSFTQPYGDDFSALPAPSGEELEAAGFKQDLSCFANSAYPTMEHPILSGITATTVTAGFDGFFRKIPANATVLLRRTISGEPCLILYPVGQGYVVASTLYEDWGYANGQSTADGRSILANILSWAKNPNPTIPVTNLSAGGSASGITLTLHVRNMSDTAADQMEVLVMTPDRQTLAVQLTQAVTIPAHSEADVPVTLDLSSYLGQSGAQYGIFHADYRLLAMNLATSQEEEIQPQGETETGRFVMEAVGTGRQALSQTVFSVRTDDDIAGNPAKTVHIHIEDHTGTARTMHMWTCYTHDYGILLDTITMPANGVLDKDVVQDLSRPGPYHYYLTDPNYGSNWGPEWAFMWGKDPWKMAAQGYAYMFGNGGPDGSQRFATVSAIAGTASYYEPTDTVTGTMTVANPRSVAEDLTVVFSLVAADRTVTQTETIHLEGGASQAVPFSLTLPGPIAYYTHSIVSAAVYLGQSLMGGTSADMYVNPWLPKTVLTALWPASPTLASLPTTPISVHIVNEAGTRVADCAGYQVRATVWEVIAQVPKTKLEEKVIPIPDLHPGDATDVTLQWAQWQPALGKTYLVQLWVELAASRSPIGGYISKSYALTPPWPSASLVRSLPGEATVALQGRVFNGGDLAWDGQMAWDCPALGVASSQAVTVPPQGEATSTWSGPRPDALPPGIYPYTATFTAPGLPAPLTTQGQLQVAAPALSLAWPETAPGFRHDQDGVLPVSVSVTGTAAPLAGTVDATMNWDGGSVPVASGVPVTLDPAQTGALTLTLPMAQMPAPGPFTVLVTLNVQQGALVQRWSAPYSLAGPAYAGGFSILTAAPGGTLAGEVQNIGAFEGNVQVQWNLADAKGTLVGEDNQTLPVSIGGTAPLSELLPANLLPGPYQSILLVTDTASGKTTSFRQAVNVTGTSPVLILSTDRSLYGTADTVGLALHVEDPGHALDSAYTHLEIQRYLGMGGQGGSRSGPPGASWNTPSGDGSGNRVVNPSAWFIDPANGSAAYAQEVSDYLPLSDVPPVAADVNGDGKAEFIGLTSARLSIASEGDLYSGEEKRFAPTARRLKEPKVISPSRPRAEGAFQISLDIPTSTWGQEGDIWNGTFLLGVRDDGLGAANPFCLGLMRMNESIPAAVLLVRLDGTVIWRHDFPAPFDSNPVDGPVFTDLNGDGTRDVLFEAGDTLYALNGATGQILWTFACPQYSGPTFRVGHAGGATRIWVAYSLSSGDVLTLLDASGQTVYQTVPAGGLEPSTLVTGDVDGDGNDEAVIAQDEQEGTPPLEVFRVASPSPVSTNLLPTLPPSLFDINDDGRDEAVFLMIAGGYDEAQMQALVAADVNTGQTVWTAILPTIPQWTRVLAFTLVSCHTSAGGKHLVLGESVGSLGLRESMQQDHMTFLIDSPSGVIEQTVENGGPAELAGDFDGDGLTEVLSSFGYYSTWLLDNGCAAPDGTLGPCAEWETVWQTDDWLTENGDSTLDIPYAPGMMATPGTYRALASAITTAGQRLEAKPSPFSVVDTALGLTISPAAGTTIRTDEPLSGSISLVNAGTAVETSITVTLLVDGQPSSTWSVSALEPGATESFTFTLAPAAAGKHTVEVQGVENGAAVASLRSSYIAAAAMVDVSVEAPASHSEEPFEIAIAVANSGDVPAHVVLTPSDDPSQPTSVDLQPEETRSITIQRQSTSAYAAQVAISGDVSQVLSVAVPYAYQLSMSVADLGPQLSGLITVPVHLAQAGPQPYAGSLTATMTQADGSTQSFAWPVQVPAGGAADVSLQIEAAVAGQAHLHIEASFVQEAVDKDVLVYRDGVGTLQIFLPVTLGEGLVQIPFTVQNGLAAQGSFNVQLNWSAGGTTQTVAEANLSVAGSGSAAGTLTPALAHGNGTLQALLNGVPVASQSITILPLVQADLTLNALQPSDAAPSVTAVIENSGFGPLDGTLEVRTDAVYAIPVHVDAGSQLTQTVSINPDGFGGDDAPVSVVLHLPGGSTVERNLALALKAASLFVAPPPSPVILTPGQPSTLGFTVTNAGDLKAPVTLAVDLEDGESGHFEQATDVPGHGSTQVEAAVNLLPDIPNGVSNAHYIIRRAGGSGEPLAEGYLPVTIQGPAVAVSASLDGVAYPVGATATANVALSLTPPDASPKDVQVRVIGGTFEEERSVTVSGTQSESFAVPVSSDTDGVSVEVIQPGGRSLYINRLRIYPVGTGFAIHPDKSVYQAGESVSVSANLPSAGALHLNFMNQDVTLQGSGTVNQSFSIPADAAEDSYTVAYDYTPTDTTVSPASGGMSVDVHGIVVTGGESRLDKSAYAIGENLTGRVVLYANQNLTGTLKFWVVAPDGSYGYAGDQAVALAPGGAPGRFPFTFPFTTTQAGTHRVAFSLVGSSGTSYVGGSLPFHVGSGILLGVAATQASYPQGTEAASVILRTAGTGAAAVIVELDENAAAQNSFTLNGIQALTLGLGSVSPGEHAVKATLTDGAGLVSVARCRFLYGSSLPDLTGSVSAGCRTGDTLPLFLMVTNGGASSAGASTMALYDGNPQAGGVLIAAVPVPALAPGSQFTFGYDWAVAGAEGLHDLYLAADSQSAVPEWDESNNTAHSSVTVAATVAVDVMPSDNTCSAQPIVPLAQTTPEGTPVTATLNGATYSWGTPIASEGDYQLVATASTECGAGVSVTRHYVIDTTFPAIQISGVEDGATYTTPVAPAFQATDANLGATSALLNDQPFMSGTAVSAPGSYALNVSATDCAGNRSQATAHFTLDGSPVPILPPIVGMYAGFGCNSVAVNGHNKVFGVASVGSTQGFGGHLASNGAITISGQNVVNGNATPGPGKQVKITGSKSQVLGSTAPAAGLVPCEEQNVAEWASYAQVHNDNSSIPSQFLDGQGNFKINGNRTCTLLGGTYYVASFTMTGSSKLVLGDSATMVVTGAITINGPCLVNQNGDPSHLILVSSSASPVSLNGTASVDAIVYAPLAPVTVNGNITGYGNLWGKTLLGNGSCLWGRPTPEAAPATDDVATESR